MNGNEPAFLQLDKHGTHEGVTHYGYRGGLTKREWLAGMALQGLVAGPNIGDLSWDQVASDAVGYTDALLAELEKEGK